MKSLERSVVTSLVEASRSIAHGKQVQGIRGKALTKIAGSPRLERPMAASTRPRSLSGSTFHFRHTVKSKRNDISADAASHTTAAAHQGYIERRAAVEPADTATLDATLGTERELTVDAGRASFGRLGQTRAEREAFWHRVEAVEGKAARVRALATSSAAALLLPGSKRFTKGAIRDPNARRQRAVMPSRSP